MSFGSEDREAINELKVKVATLEKDVKYIKDGVDEIKSVTKKLENSVVESKIERQTLSKDLEALTNIVKNHLEWHKEERARTIVYVSITAGIVASLLSYLLQLLLR